MNLVEFQQTSKRTMPFNGEPQNHIEFENMLGNYALGLLGEAVELFELFADRDSSCEASEKEIGDIMHYAVGLAAILNIPLENIGAKHLGIFDTEFEMMVDLITSAKNVSEKAKKYIYHRHKDLIVEGDLKQVIARLYQTVNFLGCDMSEILQMNINKLKTRYPEKFSVEDSIARKDVQG